MESICTSYIELEFCHRPLYNPYAQHNRLVSLRLTYTWKRHFSGHSRALCLKTNTVTMDKWAIMPALQHQMSTLQHYVCTKHYTCSTYRGECKRDTVVTTMTLHDLTAPYLFTWIVSFVDQQDSMAQLDRMTFYFPYALQCRVKYPDYERYWRDFAYSHSFRISPHFSLYSKAQLLKLQ